MQMRPAKPTGRSLHGADAYPTRSAVKPAFARRDGSALRAHQRRTRVLKVCDEESLRCHAPPGTAAAA
jgi:hypothetical protein